MFLKPGLGRLLTGKSVPKVLCLVREGFGNGDNLWVELGWVQCLHEASVRGEMGHLHPWLLGVHFRTSTYARTVGRPAELIRSGRNWCGAPKLLTSLSPNGSRDLDGPRAGLCPTWQGGRREGMLMDAPLLCRTDT
jgi:hypothetical protein